MAEILPHTANSVTMLAIKLIIAIQSILQVIIIVLYLLCHHLSALLQESKIVCMFHPDYISWNAVVMKICKQF